MQKKRINIQIHKNHRERLDHHFAEENFMIVAEV